MTEGLRADGSEVVAHQVPNVESGRLPNHIAEQFTGLGDSLCPFYDEDFAYGYDSIHIQARPCNSLMLLENDQETLILRPCHPCSAIRYNLFTLMDPNLVFLPFIALCRIT